MVLQWCYSDVTVALQWCYRLANSWRKLSFWCYKGVMMMVVMMTMMMMMMMMMMMCVCLAVGHARSGGCAL